MTENGSGRPQQITSLPIPMDTLHRRPLALYPEKPLPPDPPSMVHQLPMSDFQTSSEVSEPSTPQSIRSSSFAPSEEEPDTKAQTQLYESSQIRKAYSKPSRGSPRADKGPAPETDSVEHINEKDLRNTDRYLFPKTASDVGMAFYVFRHPIVILQT